MNEKKSLDRHLGQAESNIHQVESSLLDYDTLILMLQAFQLYVEYMDKKLSRYTDGRISFGDGFLEEEESYKTRVAANAREVLRIDSWKESQIGTGSIAGYAREAIHKAENLVDFNQKVHFKNKLGSEGSAERALFDIFRGSDEAKAFADAVKVFGGHYDLIGYLFFIKDSTRFLPIRSRKFDERLEMLNIDHRTSHSCNWENYTTFIRIISEIQSLMNENLQLKAEVEVRLIDAHSFVWMVPGIKYYIEKAADDDAKARIAKGNEELRLRAALYGSHTPEKRDIKTTGYKRSSAVVAFTRERAKGICQLCGQPAPFEDLQGNPYLEIHHVIWLGRKGPDKVENAVALCPNCHSKMHVRDERADIDMLIKMALQQ